MTTERYVAIPDEVRDVYRLWRPTPLYRARRLEKALGTPARIYYKYEGVSPAGSHKPNTAVPQAYYNAAEGIKRLTTETGAGQWGTALAFACALFGIECEVWMVRASLRHRSRTGAVDDGDVRGARCTPARPATDRGGARTMLADDPDSPGSLGIAISEAVEVAAADADTSYALGSVLNHVLLHQTVIGEEALLQFAAAGDGARPGRRLHRRRLQLRRPDLPVPAREAGRRSADPVILAVEPAACPSFTHGRYAYDFGDTAGFTPLMKMHTLGHDFIPDPIHAGGLRYHGMSPLLSHMYELGLFEAVARQQRECFAAGDRCSPAPRASSRPRSRRTRSPP